MVRLSLFDPNGAFAANTRPQGGANPANYGLVTVKHPVDGYLDGRALHAGQRWLHGQREARQHGPTAHFRSAPSRRAATRWLRAIDRCTVSVPVPSVGGDTVYTVSIGSSGGHQVAVPMILRALSCRSAGSFTGTITGGNARAFSPAQTFTFAFDVPTGKRDLSRRPRCPRTRRTCSRGS